MIKTLDEVGLIMTHVRKAAQLSVDMNAATEPTLKTQAPRWDYTFMGGDRREPS